MCAWACRCTHMEIRQHLVGNWSSPSTMWISGIELKLSALVLTSAFPKGPSHWPEQIVFRNHQYVSITQISVVKIIFYNSHCIVISEMLALPEFLLAMEGLVLSLVRHRIIKPEGLVGVSKTETSVLSDQWQEKEAPVAIILWRLCAVSELRCV